MTMKPRGKKFRIRRSGPTAPAGESQRAAESAAAAQGADDGFGSMRFPTSGAAQAADAAQQAAPQAPPQVSVEQELAAIRAEGLTGRQLRMARRTAQKHGLQPASDFDAVRLLRRQGIDPFERSNMLELVVNDGDRQAEAQRLPATVRQPGVPQTQAPAQPPAMPAPSTDEANRAQEILRMQRDIARRRRKRLILLAARLLVFVMLPTAFVGYYYYTIATPMYAATTVFQIQKAESGSASAGGLAGLMGGTTFATVQDSISVQNFLESREAMLLLDDELGLRDHFSAPDIDPLNRLDPEATTEDLYRLYSRNLTIGYDPTEGLIRMEVLAADPAVAQDFSRALLRYAEQRVDSLTQRVREDQMRGARESYETAEAALSAAQARVVNLQERSGILSSDAEVSSLFNQISTFQIQLQEERLRLDEIQSVDQPNETRVEVAQRNIARLEALIDSLRSSMTQDQPDEASLARVSSELVVAQADLETRQLMLSQSMQQMEAARVEADRQSLYLTVSVNPVAPDEAAYPRKMENTMLAFLIFSGIYLMLSMTASILREQVSA